MDSQIKNATDADQIEQDRLISEVTVEKSSLIFQSIMDAENGRRFIWELIQSCDVFKSTFTGDNVTFFKEGVRSVGLRLLKQINDTCPEQYSVMATEAKNREEKIKCLKKKS